MELTFHEFSRKNSERCESGKGFGHKLESWSTSDWMVATLGELGEAANIVKKLNRVRDGMDANFNKGLNLEELKSKLYQELGDTYIYLDLMCQSLGIDISQAAKISFNKKSMELGCDIFI